MINRIGYTKEGLVFLVIDGEYNGEPIQTITQMVPSAAIKVSEAIRQAAEKAPNVGNSASIN